MYTSIKEFVKAKKADKINENISNPVTTSHTRIATPEKNQVTEVTEDNELSTLESVLKNLSICHLILNKGLINESSSLTSINESVKENLGIENFFGTEEEFNKFYVDTLSEMNDFLTSEGFFSKLGDTLKGTKKYILDDTLKVSKEAEGFVSNPARKKIVDSIEKSLKDKYAMDDNQAKKAALALADFTQGEAVIMTNLIIEFDKASNELSVTKKGSLSPVAGNTK